jgi:hypothetical protein
MLAHGINKIQAIQAVQAVAALTQALTAVDCEYLAALVLQDKDFQVVQEYVSTMTAKTRTTAVVAGEQAALAGPAKTKINKRPLMAALVQPAIS